MGCPKRPRQHGSWSSDRRVRGRSHELQPPFFVYRMLVGPDDGRVDHDVFEVWIIGHGGEHPCPRLVSQRRCKRCQPALKVRLPVPSMADSSQKPTSYESLKSRFGNPPGCIPT